MGKHIQIIDEKDSNFKEELALALNTEGSSSDYSNSKDRPYNGQAWTIDGIRGQQEVKGITMRDIKDCFIQALLVSSCNEEFSDKVFEISDDPDIGKGTKYAGKGTWVSGDVYKLDLNEIDPIAVAQNLTCFIEHYMGIYPNNKLPGIPTIDELMDELK